MSTPTRLLFRLRLNPLQRVRKRPQRPVWLSSDRRTVSDMPPVLTPAERAAIEVGDDPQELDAENEEHPPAQTVEVPGGGRVDPSAG